MNIEVNKLDIQEIVIELHNIARHIEQNRALDPMGRNVRLAADQLSAVVKRQQQKEI